MDDLEERYCVGHGRANRAQLHERIRGEVERDVRLYIVGQATSLDITREQAAWLAPQLQHYANTGRLPEENESGSNA